MFVCAEICHVYSQNECICQTQIYVYCKTSLNRSIMRPTLSGPLGRWSVQEVKTYVWLIVWDRNKTIDIGEWSICEGGRLESFYCIYIYLHIYIYISIAMYIPDFVAESLECRLLVRELESSISDGIKPMILHYLGVQYQQD